MRFSILTPSYNQGRFLERNIQSVLDQDVPLTEHIICDGGSTDETTTILGRHESRLAYWVSEKDGGQADALNKALTRATGDIIGWINVDEFYEPNIFHIVQSEFEADPELVMVYGSYRQLLDDGTHVRINRPCSFDYDICLFNACTVTNCAAFFRRDRLVECGGFDPSFQFMMDNEMYLRLMAGNQKWKRLDRVIGNFTLHRASKTSTLQGMIPEERWRMRHRVRPDLTPEEMELEGRRAIRKMYWLMLRDGVLLEKIWFNAMRRRRYSSYYGDTGPRLPYIAPIVDRVVDFVERINRTESRPGK